MKKRVTSIMAGILCIVMLLSLAACGGNDAPATSTNSNSGSSTSGNAATTEKPAEPAEPIYLSDMLEDGGTRIWYYVASIGKDERVSVFVFENGEVARYGNGIYLSKLTLGDVAKMTDEEILELLDQTERTYRAEIFAKNDISVISEEMATAFPYPYSLNVITDSTGNNTKSENIIYTYTPEVPARPGATAEELFENRETKIKLSPTYRQGNVYESLFGGFVGNDSSNVDGIFITRIPGGEAPSPSPKLDTPQHPGVIVD